MACTECYQLSSCYWNRGRGSYRYLILTTRTATNGVSHYSRCAVNAGLLWARMQGSLSDATGIESLSLCPGELYQRPEEMISAVRR